ncbi:MAG: glutamine amidotransferase [Solirubrobacterales bacterium]
MKSCVAIRHVAFEDLGNLQPVLAARGFDVRYLDAACDDLSALDPVAADLMVVLGGPIGVYEDEAYPFLKQELAIAERRLAADRPTLGICLGAQIMARALGARVYPNPAGKEIGWSALDLTPEGEASVLRGLAGTPVLHWHGDTFDLPHGAVPLASTPITRNQAYSWGLKALGLQFHIEVVTDVLESWYVGHAAEIAAVTGLSVPELRAEAANHGPGLEARGGEALARWIDEVCP